MHSPLKEINGKLRIPQLYQLLSEKVEYHYGSLSAMLNMLHSIMN